MDLEAAVDAKQKDVDKVQDQRVRAYLRSRELHVRTTAALEELAALARERQQQPPQSAATSIAWSMKSCLRRTLAKRYTPPEALVRSASTDPDSPASSCSTASSFAFGGDPIPAPLSIAGLLDCIPKHTASDVLPYACGPSPPFAGVLQHAAQSRRSHGALDIAEATVNRFTLLLQPLQEAVAAARGMPAARVRWHLQSPWNVATGTPVSFTPAMTSQECLSSGYFCAVAVAMENLFLAISLNPAEPLPQLPGMPKSCQEGAAATAAVAKVICDELFALRASVPHTHSTCDTTIKAHMSCGVEDTCPVSRGVPHAIVGVCCRYRKHLPRWQWLQALAAFIAVAGGLLKGIATAGDSCRHRQPDGSDGGVHVMGHCPRCAVGASIVSCLIDCMTREAEEARAVQPLPMHVLRERLVEVSGFAAVMLSQTLLEEPCLSRMFFHNEVSEKHVEQQVKAKERLTLTLYGRLQLSKHHRDLAAAMWRSWCGRRRQHDAVFHRALRHFRDASGASTFRQPLCLEDYMLATPEWLDFGAGDVIAAPPPAPVGTTPGGLGPMHDALEWLRAVHKLDGDMMAEVTRVLRMPGAIFLPEQLALAIPLTTHCSMTAVDWLWVCRCAAEDAMREETFAGLD